jgi:hypothetical protein
MTTAKNQGNNLSSWKPGQSGNPSGRPKGTRDLAGYVLETTDGGKELVDALVSIARGVMPNVAVQEGRDPDVLSHEDKPMPTYCNDTVVYSPAVGNAEEDIKSMREIGRKLAEDSIKNPPLSPMS